MADRLFHFVNVGCSDCLESGIKAFIAGLRNFSCLECGSLYDMEYKIEAPFREAIKVNPSKGRVVLFPKFIDIFLAEKESEEFIQTLFPKKIKK